MEKVTRNSQAWIGSWYWHGVRIICRCVHWRQLAQDMVHWLALMKANLIESAEFPSALSTINFQRWAFSELFSSVGNNTNSTAVCSHGRVWEIFLEILTSKHCQFIGFSCPALRDFRRDFLHGNCFRSCDEDISTCGVMGQAGKARGALYLVTRPSSPYCGEQ